MDMGNSVVTAWGRGIRALNGNGKNTMKITLKKTSSGLRPMNPAQVQCLL